MEGIGQEGKAPHVGTTGPPRDNRQLLCSEHMSYVQAYDE